MAGSGGSLDDHEIDFDHDGLRNRFSSASVSSSQVSDDVYGEEVFSPEPQGENVFSMTNVEDGIQPQRESQEEDENGDIGPLTPRGKIIGNGFDRPIHRQRSLQEFEHLELTLKDQSQESAEGVGMDERFLLGNGNVLANGGLNGGYEVDRRSSGDMDFRSDHDYDMSGSGRHNGVSESEHSFGSAAEGEENMHNESDDMMKYMQATPRSTVEVPSGEEHGLSRLMEKSYDNDSLDDYGGEVNGHYVPQMSSQPDFFSLSQERLPEEPSHLESEDGSDLFGHSRNNTPKGRESLTTVIQAAATNVETFGTGSSPEGKKDASGGDVEHFKPIATSHRRPSRPQTAAQLKNKTISEQSSASEQNLQQSIDGKRKTNSVKSFRTRSSRASTPQSVLSQSSRRSSCASIRSHDDQSEYSIQESVGQVSQRSSTPGRNSTLVRQVDEFSPSPVKHDRDIPVGTIPRLRLDNMSARSDLSSTDLQHLDKSARSRLLSDEFVDQLQEEHDELLQKHAQLLQKHAQAENTIDSLRLGARVNLHYEGAPGGQPGNAGPSPAKHGQSITLPQGQKGVVSRSGLTHPPGGNSTIHLHTTSNVSMGASTSNKGKSQMALPDASEGKLLALQFQTEGHKEKMDSYEILLQENHLNPVDQQRGLEGLKSGQDKLEADYMQAKEEHNLKVRLGSATGQQAIFDPEKSLEGQLFQLGMRLEDLQEIVQDNLRSNPPELPATPQRKASDATMATGDGSVVDLTRGQSNTQSPEEDYALLLSRYDALKQLPPHPERDREIQQLVKSLQDMPDSAVVSMDQLDNGDGAGFHGNDAEMIEEDEMDFDDDGEDHDGDVDRSSSHSSPFRETTSPDVFRPKGTRQDELPKWQPPGDGSISSLGSPDHDQPSSSVHSRRKSIPGKSSTKQTPPRPNSDHRSSHRRGDAGGDTRKQRGNKSTHGTHLEPEGDSGFLGSESSRQSLQTRGSDTRTRNRAQRLPAHSEIPKIVPIRDSRLPSQESQRRSMKTPLRSNEPVPLRQQAVPEEEDSIYSGGGKRARGKKPEVMPRETQDSVYSGGSKRAKERSPQKMTPREHQRRDTRSVSSQPHAVPSPIKQREQRANGTPPPAQQSRHPSNDQGIPLGSQYLSRSANHQNSRVPAPQRVHHQRTEPPRRPRESPQRHQQPEFDGRSDVTRSSVRSDALRALQDDVNQLRTKMMEANRNPPPIPEESRYSRMRNHDDGDEDRLSSRSSKSEMLHMLQEEITDLKDQLADRDATPSRMHAPYASSTPLRDTIRDVLRERYIPRSNAFFGASPIHTSPKKYNSGTRHENWSTMRTPSRPATDNQSYAFSRGANYTPSSPPAVSRRPGGFQTPGVRYQTETMLCPTCGGSGSHTHGEYSYPPPPPHRTPPPEAYVPTYSSQTPSSRVYPQAPYYTPTQPNPAVALHTMPGAPQNNHSVPLNQGQSYVLQQPYTSAAPQPITVVPQATQQVPAATPATPAVNQTSTHQPSGTPSHLHPDARPVYLIPGKSRGRYYLREEEEEEEGSSAGGGEEEFYYRRTPKSSRTRNRHTPRTVKHQKVSEVPAELQLSLDDALHMAQRLKRTTHQMVSSVRRDVRLAESFN
ncbi:microtubule organization protein AKNA isoform X2 [Strongylocentrotus purpuratus]|uniref:AKNA domain-containing protein n=1 Tax=Strongylocentrotus purpuratus TaxID=7668 RepID=A0A7M7HH30_STRPU|nr:microtubule organization protein AKNA isoform X2 [Strongylocentrotus purpuratus]